VRSTTTTCLALTAYNPHIHSIIIIPTQTCGEAFACSRTPQPAESIGYSASHRR